MKLSFVLTGGTLAAASLWLEVAEVRSLSVVAIVSRLAWVALHLGPLSALLTAGCSRLSRVPIARSAPVWGGVA
jgi:hypothetical protein